MPCCILSSLVMVLFKFSCIQLTDLWHLFIPCFYSMNCYRPVNSSIYVKIKSNYLQCAPKRLKAQIQQRKVSMLLQELKPKIIKILMTAVPYYQVQHYEAEIIEILHIEVIAQFFQLNQIIRIRVAVKEEENSQAITFLKRQRPNQILKK